MFNTDRIRRFCRACRTYVNTLSWSQQLLLAMAGCSYITLGIYLGLFSNGSDLMGFYQAAHRVLTGHGADIYHEFFTVDPARHPLMFGYTAPTALLFAPLGLLSPRLAWPVFQIISHACLVAAWYLAVQEARDRKINEAPFRMAVGMLLFFPLYLSLWLGQCEPMILVMIIGAMRLNRYGYVGWAGLAIAMAICLKIFLAFFLVYFLWTRRLRLLRACVVSLIVLEAASLCVVPLDVQLQFWRFAPIWTARIQPFFDNYAVSGPLFRLLTINYYTTGIAHLKPLVEVLVWGISSLIVVIYLRQVRPLSKDDFGLGFSFTLATALLISPVTDTHHFALLLIPFLFHAFSSDTPPGWRWFYSFFAVYVPFVAFRYPDMERYGYFIKGVPTLIFSLPFFVLLAFWIYLPQVRRGGRKDSVWLAD